MQAITPTTTKTSTETRITHNIQRTGRISARENTSTNPAPSNNRARTNTNTTTAHHQARTNTTQNTTTTITRRSSSTRATGTSSAQRVASTAITTTASQTWTPAVGDRIQLLPLTSARFGLVRYVGHTQFARGNWIGVELETPGESKLNLILA
jgi:hypothetical protein